MITTVQRRAGEPGKTVYLSTVSSETNLADGMVATGFACLRSYLTDNNLDRFGRIAQTPLDSGVLAQQQWIYVWLRMVRV